MFTVRASAGPVDGACSLRSTSNTMVGVKWFVADGVADISMHDLQPMVLGWRV